MDAELRQAAVDDVLECCRNERHVMSTGRLLAPVLLGQAWSDELDDYRIMAAVRTLLETELARWRQQRGLRQRTATDERKAEAIVKEDLATHHKKLVPLSLVWASYIDHLTTVQLAQLSDRSERSIQLKIRDGRVELARLIAQREVEAASSPPQNAQHQHDQGGQPPAQPPTPDDDVAPMLSAQVEAARRLLRERVRERQRSKATDAQRRRQHRHVEQDISGDNVQAVIGPVSGSVNQYQTQHVHHHAATDTETTVSQSDDMIFWMVVLLLGAMGYWLMHRAPWLSIGTVFLICAWRAGRHGWLTAREWSHEADPENVWWRIGYTLAWLGALVWTALMAAKLPAIVAAPEFSLERLTLIVSFVGAGAYVFWLSFLDVLLWVQHAPTRGWPWRLLKRHAESFWQQRWLMLGITWLALVVLSVAMLLVRFGSGEEVSVLQGVRLWRDTLPTSAPTGRGCGGVPRIFPFLMR